MACRTVALGHGAYALVCTREKRTPPRRCIVCHIPETMATIKLCDFRLPKGQTCDAVMCLDHALHVDPDEDYCPNHARLGEPGASTPPP
jgi:hypothetical protein